MLVKRATGQLTIEPRSNEGLDAAVGGTGEAASDGARGRLLHPSLDRDVDENVTVQGHRIRFATVDLTLSGDEMRAALLR